jgi:hypothetical protein
VYCEKYEVGDVQTDLVGFLSLENFENPFSLGFGGVSHGKEFRECDDTKVCKRLSGVQV